MIKLQNVSKYYNSNGVVALGLRKVNLELHRNEFVAIVGESGSGKTTLLNVISGIDSYEDGEMYVNGKETSYFSVEDMEDYRKNYIAFVFQTYNLIESYTVLQNVEAPLILSGYPKDKIRTRAKNIIKRVGLEEHINHKATKLSGGQKQRVVIARALAKDCPVIAADEPTGNLDSKSAKEVIELLREISKEKLVIIVTHDFSQVEKYATRKIRVFDGEIVEDLELKKTDKLDLPEIDSKVNKIRFTDYLTISLRNLLAVPKKTLLMLIIFTFFSFFVALTYGSSQMAQSEANLFVNQEFTNSSPNRIALRKDDDSPFTLTEIEEIKDSSSKIIEVVDFDYILDYVFYGAHTAAVERDNAYISGVFMPQSFIDEDDLVYGRMPEDDNEIVIGLGSYELENYYDKYLNKTFNSSEHYRNTPFYFDYTVVGIVDQSTFPSNTYTWYEGYFFGTDANFESLKEKLYLVSTLEANLFYTDNTMQVGEQDVVYSFTNANVLVDNTLDDYQVKVSHNSYYGNCTGLCTFNGEIIIEDNYRTEEYINTLEIEYIVDNNLDAEFETYFVNQATYDLIFYDDVYQVSVITNTEIGVDNIVSNLQGSVLFPSDYHVVYPYDTETTQDFEAIILLMSNIGSILLNVIVLVGSTLITYAIFKAIINTKLPDYAIFRTIGANKIAIKRFIYIENFFIVIVSFIIFVIVSIAVPQELVVNTFLATIKIYNFTNYIVFFGLLVLMAVMISRRYCNKIFMNTVQTTLKGNIG